MKKKHPEFRNWILKIGCRYLKQLINSSLVDEDLVLTTGREDAAVLTLDEAVDCQKKIMATYPGLMPNLLLASLKP